MTEPMAEASRAAHPNRLRFAMFSDRNPLMPPVKGWRIGAFVASTRQCGQSTAGHGAGGFILDHNLPAKLWRVA